MLYTLLPYIVLGLVVALTAIWFVNKLLSMSKYSYVSRKEYDQRFINTLYSPPINIFKFKRSL